MTGYYPRSGMCNAYDRRLTQALADKAVDLLLREEYGKMPVLNKVCSFYELEEYNCGSIDMGKIGNRPLPNEYFDADKLQFTEMYKDFLQHIIGKPKFETFDVDFTKVNPFN